MSTLLRSVVIAGALAAPLASQAAAPTLADVLKASGVTESGYINATYNYNNRQFDSAGFAYNDGSYAGFTLNQVGLMLSSTPSSGFGGVIDILGGQDASFVAGDLNTLGCNGNFGCGSDIIFKQAYAQYATGALTIMGGRFVTLAGTEVIAATGNSNATRSLLFAIQPLTHTGVRASFKAGALTFTGGLNNSVGGTTYDNNPQKTGELQVAFATDTLSLALTGYKGEETPGPSSNPASSPLLIDFVGSLTVTKALSLGLNVDHKDFDNGTPKTKQDGIALYANLQATDVLRVGARVEYLKTKDGFFSPSTSTTQKQKELTLTGALALAPNFDLVTDVRFDKDDGNYGGTDGDNFSGHDSMDTVVVSGIYKF